MKIVSAFIFSLFLSVNAIAAGCTPPVITSQPADTVVCENGNILFSIMASGPSLIYQWQVDQGTGYTNLSNVAPYSGVTTSVLNITTVPFTLDNASYRCIVSNGCIPNDTSNGALLKVNIAPSIAIQPSNISVCENGSASFGVATGGTQLSYQWQVNTGSGFVNVPSGAPYSGDTTGTLYITGASASMTGYLYQCIVSGACSSSLTSVSAALTIDMLPNILSQPNFIEVCEGNNTTINITANGTGISYQWQVDQGSGYVNLTNASPYSGVNTNSLSVTTVAAAMNGYAYQCIVSGNCSPADTSYEIPLIVHPTYVNYISQTICQGDVFVFGTSNLTAPGFYSSTFSSAYSCDSLVYLSLNVSSAYYTTTTSVICDGDSISIGGNYQSSAGVYTYVLPTISGCDSTIENTLSVLPSYNFSQTTTICQGDSALIFGVYEMTDSVYTDNYFTYLGCDSSYSHTLIVQPNYNISVNADICQGDSILIGGTYQSVAGMYPNSYTSAYGCDSLVTTTLIVHPDYNQSQSLYICSYDSILLAGSYQTTAGVYTDNLISTFGCDSIVVTTLSVNIAPVVTFDGSTSVCDTSASFLLAGGSPAGGAYSGPGVSGGMFSPGAAGIGAHAITYTFTDSAGCSDAVASIITVTVCSGVDELINDLNFSVYPNPFNDELTIISTQHSAELTIFNVLGEIVYSQKIAKGSSVIPIEHAAKGIYFVQIRSSGKMMTKKLVKE